MFYATEKCSKLVIVKLKLILVIIVKRHYFDLVIPQHCQGEIILGPSLNNVLFLHCFFTSPLSHKYKGLLSNYLSDFIPRSLKWE